MRTTLFDSIIGHIAACLTQDAAQKIVALQADQATQARVDELADKANMGTLAADEKSEYDRYLAAFHFVTILQAKARSVLQT